MNLFSGFIFQIIGATVMWTIKGFKGSIDNEMAGPEDDNWKSTRNIIISIIIIIIALFVVNKYNDSKDDLRNSSNYEFRYQ